MFFHLKVNVLQSTKSKNFINKKEVNQNMAMEETISTGVDSLVKLVKKEKEISFDKAANELDVPFQTIESWATFLEEEGLVTVVYKFTTPYLVYKSHDSEEDKGNTKAINDASSELSQLFSMLDDRVEKEDYTLAHKHSIAIHKKLKELISYTRKDKKLSMKLDHDTLLNRIDGFLNFISHTKTLMSKKDYSRIKSAFKRIKEDFSDVYNELMTNIQETKQERVVKIEKKEEEKVEEPIEIEQPKEGKIGFKDKSTDYNSLINEAEEYMKKGDLESVKQIYTYLEKTFRNLPEKFKNDRENVKDALLKINTRFTSNLSETSLKTVDDISKEIENLIANVKNDIKEKNFKNAEKMYSQIEKLFNSMPEGFIEKKMEIENKIIDLHAEIINGEKVKYSRDLILGENEIHLALHEIEDLIKKGNINQAFAFYKEIREQYASLPEGFLDDKIMIQNKILSIYQKLQMASKKSYEDDFNEKAAKIEVLSKKAEESLNREDFDSAFLEVKDVNELFDTLPRGFLEQKSRIETNLLNLSKRISFFEKEHASKKFNTIKERITKLFTSLNNYLQRNENELAKEMYKEIITLYNNFPKGYLREKTEIKNKILIAYGQLMINSDSEYLGNVEGGTKKKYKTLLKLIISVHELIEQREFDKIEEKYNSIARLYNELPIGFIQKRIHIRHEILKVSDELQLYKKIKELEGITDPSKTRGLLETIRTLYDELYDGCREDSELFDFVKEKYDHYSATLKKGSVEKAGFMRESDRNVTKKNVVDESRKNNISGSLYEDAITLLVSGNLNEAYLNLKTILSTNSSDTRAGYLLGIISKLKNNQIREKYGTEIGLFLSILKRLHLKSLDSVDAKLARIKLIRGFYEYLNGNKTAVKIDINRLSEIYTSDEEIIKFKNIIGLR